MRLAAVLNCSLLGVADDMRLLGLLAGASVSLLYTAACLPLRRLIDAGIRRVRFITIVTAVWSFMTALRGMAQDFVQFVLARMGVGLGEAGFTPAAHSLISNLYPVERRPFAMGLFALGVPLGIMLGMVIGGVVAEHAGHSNPMIAHRLVGVQGILVRAGYRRSSSCARFLAVGLRTAVALLRPNPCNELHTAAVAATTTG